MSTGQPEGPTDREILTRAARGDRSAFGLFFDRHAAAACRYASRLTRDRATAEDSVHEAFVRLIDAARRGVFDPDRGTPRGLLFRTVRNICIDWFRHRAKESQLDNGSCDSGCESRDAAFDARDDFESLLAGITEPQRTALLLRVDGGLSYDEIATVLDATLPQVKTWIFRARRVLSEQWLETS